MSEGVARTIKAEWIIRSLKDKRIPVEGWAVLVENGYFADVTADVPAQAERIDIAGGLAFLDYLNQHGHAINAPAAVMIWRAAASAQARSAQC